MLERAQVVPEQALEPEQEQVARVLVPVLAEQAEQAEQVPEQAEQAEPVLVPEQARAIRAGGAARPIPGSTPTR